MKEEENRRKLYKASLNNAFIWLASGEITKMKAMKAINMTEILVKRRMQYSHLSMTPSAES